MSAAEDWWGCLTAGHVRPSVVVRAWLTEEGQLTQSSITREAICVHRRLNYTEADALMATGQDATSQHLRDLFRQAKQLQAEAKAGLEQAKAEIEAIILGDKA